jgi:hypothetical protein
MSAANPFCCNGPIPLSFTNILSLIPDDATYTPLPSSGASNPLIASFLTSTIYSLVYPPHSLMDSPSISDCFMISFQAIIQVTKLAFKDNAQETASKRYFARYGNQRFRPGVREIFKGKPWKEIPKEDADDSLRPPGSAIEMGDGEVWKELAGVEKLWCEAHGAFFELRAWVKES